MACFLEFHFPRNHRISGEQLKKCRAWEKKGCLGGEDTFFCPKLLQSKFVSPVDGLIITAIYY